MADSRAKAAVIGVGILGALGLAFGTAHASEAAPAKPKPAPKKKPRPMTAKERAIALAVQYARAFGVPSSLVLAILSVQSNWRAGAVNLNNKRGGAWGYGQVTLKTAQDLNTRFPTIARKWWPKWDRTGQGLIDPAVNIAMTAYMLALAWKRYKGKPDNWLVTLLSYHQGMGGTDRLLKQGGGKLPAKLPPNATVMVQRFNRVRTGGDPVVTKAFNNERGKSAGVGSTLSDARNLAKSLDTYDKCRAALGKAAEILNRAYPIADDAPLLARMTTNIRAKLHSEIDQVNTFAQRVYGSLSNPPTLQQRQETALALIQAGDVFKNIDKAVNTGWSLFQDFEDAITRIVYGAVKLAADAAKGALGALPWYVPVGGAVVVGALLISKTR